LPRDRRRMRGWFRAVSLMLSRMRKQMRIWIFLASCLAGTCYFEAQSLAASFEQLKLAQAQGEGGSLGGSIDAAPPAPARRAPPSVRAPAAKSSEYSRPKSEGGNFDGAWSVSSSPCGSNQVTSESNQVTISSGRVIGPGVSGSVNAQGVVRTVGSNGGVTIIGTGRIHGRSAGGTYRRSDGCSGTWRAIKL